MPARKKLDDPTNRVICIFVDYRSAIEAKAALIELGTEANDILILNHKSAATEIDTSAKWFADTDEELKLFAREIRSGHCLLSTPLVELGPQDELLKQLKRCGASHITRFGQWITEELRP